MDANKKLEMLELEFGLTINHAAEVLEEYVNTLKDLLDEDSVEAAIEDAFNNIAKNLNPILKEQERRERLKEHEEDIQERLNRHIDEAIDEVISKKQERNRLLRLLNQNQMIIVL